LTGGQCELLSSPEARAEMGDARKLVTHAACKAVGGKWFGGHDISGHVFLLVLGSAFLWMEILPVILRHAGLREERLVAGRKAGVTSAAVETQSIGDVDGAEEEKEGSGGVSAALVVAVLSWWMLLMTAAYFHTWFEKVSAAMSPMSRAIDADPLVVHRPFGRLHGHLHRLLPAPSNTGDEISYRYAWRVDSPRTGEKRVPVTGFGQLILDQPTHLVNVC